MRHYTLDSTADLNSLDWNINVSGTMRFDKMLAKIPSVGSAGTVLEVDAKISVVSGRAVVHDITVHFVFDVTFQGPNPAGQHMLKAFGSADIGYPCDTGDEIHANLTVDLKFGAVSVPPVLADFLYYCGDRPATQTVYEIDVVMLEPFNVMNLFELSEAHAHVNAYKYPTGGSWFTVRITGETNPEVGALQFDADVFISTKKDPGNEHSRGFSMNADLTVSYTSSAFTFEAKGRVKISDECDSMELMGSIVIGGPVASDRAATARLGGAMDSLKARAIVIIPCAAKYVDDTTGRSGDALSGKITPEPGMTVQVVNVSAMIDEWKVGALTVTDATLDVDAVLRSDGAFTIMAHVAGNVVFDAVAGSGPSGLGGVGVIVDSRVRLRLGKTSFCLDCALELLDVDVQVSVNVKQDAFNLRGEFLYHYPCVVGNAVSGEAVIEIHAGEMAVELGVNVKYYCGNLTDGSPTMTFAFYGRGKVTRISRSLSLKELTVRAAVYTNEDGTWDVSGQMEGIAVIDGDAASVAAAAALGWAPSRAQTWRHVLAVEVGRRKF